MELLPQPRLIMLHPLMINKLNLRHQFVLPVCLVEYIIEIEFMQLLSLVGDLDALITNLLNQVLIAIQKQLQLLRLALAQTPSF